MKIKCFCGEKLELPMGDKYDPMNMVKCFNCEIIHGTYSILDNITSEESVKNE